MAKYRISSFAHSILKDGRILKENETPEEMLTRISKTLFRVETIFGTNAKEIRTYEEQFESLLRDKKIVMSTPIMTNAGNKQDKPLSACVVVNMDGCSEISKIGNLVKELHTFGMGTGFSLDNMPDPIGTLKYLNKVAIQNARSGIEDRPVGNMAIMSVHNPRIMPFIEIKSKTIEKGIEWKFNLSVDITQEFMKAVFNGSKYELLDGTVLDANYVFKEIAQRAHHCGDPGIVFMQRFNRENPTPLFGEYVSVAPCAEVGLISGETCQFGYINLGKFVKRSETNNKIDYKELEHAVMMLTRALDNSLEISIPNYTYPQSRYVMTGRRKIGVGTCGFADMLSIMHIPYDSNEATIVAKDVVSWINYTSKMESVELSIKRGPFGAFPMSTYVANPGFIDKKYGDLSTATVTAKMWKELADKIRVNGIRNVTTVSLPPTGRSSLTIDASTGIEPFFSLVDDYGNINHYLMRELSRNNIAKKHVLDKIRNDGKISNISIIPENIKACFKTALEINPTAHLTIQAELQKVVDDAISKTINLPKETTSQDIENIYKNAYMLELKGITVFRIGTGIKQPKNVAK